MLLKQRVGEAVSPCLFGYLHDAHKPVEIAVSFEDLAQVRPFVHSGCISKRLMDIGPKKVFFNGGWIEVESIVAVIVPVGAYFAQALAEGIILALMLVDGVSAKVLTGHHYARSFYVFGHA